MTPDGLRVGFAGTPRRSTTALQQPYRRRLYHAAAVLTQPDWPVGRGMKLQVSPSSSWRCSTGLLVAAAQPAAGRQSSSRIAAARSIARRRRGWTCWWSPPHGLILPPWALDLPRLGCLNIHGSLLPRVGAARRRQRAIEPATRRPASASCRWMPAWTPATCCARGAAHRSRRHQRTLIAAPGRPAVCRCARWT